MAVPFTKFITKKWTILASKIDKLFIVIGIITGMMIYHDREIMQILEGEKEVVKALFQTILEDNRHTSVNVFYQGYIEESLLDPFMNGRWHYKF